MSTDSHEVRSAPLDIPQRITREALVARVGGISERTAGEWLRAMVAAGVVKKVGKITIARWSDVDAWLMSGGQAPEQAPRRRRYRGALVSIAKDAA